MNPTDLNWLEKRFPEACRGFRMEEVREALEVFLRNPYWAGYYRQAPTERCRSFVALEFFYSEHGSEETGKAMDEIEEEMNGEELRYLMKYCGNNPRKVKLARKIAEKERESGPGDR